MKISIVITTYNNVSYLQKVLESFLVQTVLPYEILVADDGSTSETASLVEQFRIQAPFDVRHVWQEHKGFRAARIRNEAIKVSSGEYIVLLDGDCIVSRHFVFDHLRLAEPGFFVQGKRVFVQQKAAAKFTYKEANSFSALFQYAVNGQITNLHHLLRIPWLPAVKSQRLKSIKSCNMGFYRQDIFAVNGFNEDYVGWGHEDSDLACRFFKYGLQKKVHAARAICFHLWHPLFKGDDRENLQRLRNAVASDEFFVPNGLMKRPPL
jgi:glycosyltransferase involved in cell wall biosynthesis